MIECGENFRFALKAREPIRIAGHRGREHLDGDRPLQIAVGRAIHLAHPAGTDGGEDLIGSKSGPWAERHTKRSIGPRESFRGEVETGVYVWKLQFALRSETTPEVL